MCVCLFFGVVMVLGGGFVFSHMLLQDVDVKIQTL